MVHFIFRFLSLLCLRSTLRIFQFWIFHRCKPMHNLNKFCHSLRHEMVSHLCIILCICYRLSHLIGLFSVTWISLWYKCTRFFIYFLFLSDEGRMLETLVYTMRIGITPTILYFDFSARIPRLARSGGRGI